MTRFAIIAATAVTVAATAAISAERKNDVKMSSVASAETLEAAIDERIATLEKSLADPEKFESSAKKLKQHAGMLAVLAQSVAQHDQKATWQLSAPDLRVVALELAGAKSHEQAAKLLEEAKNAQGGEPQGAAKDADWSKLIDIDSLMSEVRLHNSQVGRAVRKMRRGLDKEAREEVARHLELLALTGLVIAADTGHVKNKQDVEKWRAYATSQRESAVETAKAFRANDQKAVKAAYAKFKRNCTGCHKDFRK